ncbi:MAG: hypothetical protein JST36_09290 [Bacteroidetes bacterium]|nr:hypothetical protein [Bacteroidota bacterium]
MKKLTLIVAGLMIAGTSFAFDCNKDKKDCCKKDKKEAKACCKKGAETAKK